MQSPEDLENTPFNPEMAKIWMLTINLTIIDLYTLTLAVQLIDDYEQKTSLKRKPFFRKGKNQT